MSKNELLNNAQNGKKDEFYTQMIDIEAELGSYRDNFRDKIVYCNCDHLDASNFVKFFVDNFAYYGIKKLITSCYDPLVNTLFEKRDGARCIAMEYDGVTAHHIHLHGNGDFRSKECLDLLNKADIVVTNPPFSFFVSL